MSYYKTGVLYCVLAVSMLMQGKVMLAQDTLKTQLLKGVEVQENRISCVSNNVTATQLIYVGLEKIPSMQLSDVVKHFSGVTVKDYGGVGGLKTVSVRSLGANHTLVTYDGLAVSDYQTGQINIGRFSLDNMSYISLDNSDINRFFCPARSFSSASVLNFQTRRPDFSDDKPFNIKASFCGGSFSLLNPSLLVENKIGKRVSTSLNTEYIYNKGEYPFTLKNGNIISKEKRKNTDIQVFRTDANCFVYLPKGQFLSAKIFYYHAEQGLPGAVILYNTQSRQRMWDENLFTQLHYHYDNEKNIRYQANGKINYSYLRYLDPDYLNSDGKLDNKYWQREYYISNAVWYKPLRGFSMSLANDLSLGNMNTSMPDFANPTRYSSLTAFSFSHAFRTPIMSFYATLLHTYVSDKIQNTDTNIHYQKFTPSVRFYYKPFKKENITVGVSYKNIFRLPTFNDLYYRLVGNTNLSPEKTHQINLGVNWSKFLNKNSVSFARFSLAADVYYNHIQDKIIAIPNKNLFVWSMLNLGKVSITGVEARSELRIWKIKYVEFELALNYTYQYAIDMTDETSKTYKNQIPYTPKHSGSGIFTVETKWINCSYSVLYAGERYALGQNIPANRLDRYFDHSIALYRNFKLKKTELSLRAECFNLLNKQYEVVKCYPMTGRQFRAKIIFKL